MKSVAVGVDCPASCGKPARLPVISLRLIQPKTQRSDQESRRLRSSTTSRLPNAEVAEALNLSAKRSTPEYRVLENSKLPQRKRKAKHSSRRQRRKSASRESDRNGNDTFHRLTRIRLQRTIYFCLHRVSLPADIARRQWRVETTAPPKEFRKNYMSHEQPAVGLSAWLGALEP